MLWKGTGSLWKKYRCYERVMVFSGKHKDAVGGKWLTLEKKMLWKGKG
jgi:hypothetical protein